MNGGRQIAGPFVFGIENPVLQLRSGANKNNMIFIL